MVLNPLLPQMNDSVLDLVVASSRDNIVMVEAGCKEIASGDLHRGAQNCPRGKPEDHQAAGRATCRQSASPRGRSRASASIPNLLSAINCGLWSEDSRGAGQRNQAAAAGCITESVKKEAKEKLKETYANAEIGNAIEEIC